MAEADDRNESSRDLDAALLSESALAVDWNRPEEDAVWSHLQPSLELQFCAAVDEAKGYADRGEFIEEEEMDAQFEEMFRS